ncbi:MAG: PA2778 family cysteine peptidase [Bdellovibrionales bacterium]
MLRSALVLMMPAFLVACATAGVQTRAVLKSPPDIAKSSQIENVPFVRQTEAFCGPSTLTMAMQWAGHKVTLDEIGSEVFIDKKKGTLQTDMISASRRRGLVAVPLEGLVSLLKEVAAGHPVIVFENLGLSWYPQWHYSLVIGYDLNEQEVILHSGETPFKRISLNYFERGWKMADYWGLVVLPVSMTAATGDELAHLKAAVGLEQAGHTDAAEVAYQNILKRWPTSLAALIGLGNLAYNKKDFSRAVLHLQQAIKVHPDSTVARHNLSIAKKALKK